jgi:hypothetical protein
LGGQNRYIEVENLVKAERKKDELSKKTTDTTDPNNTYQKEKNGQGSKKINRTGNL